MKNYLPDTFRFLLRKYFHYRFRAMRTQVPEFPPELCADSHDSLGKRGENFAAWYVTHVMKMHVLGRNLELRVPLLTRRRQGELDIIAKDGETLVFIEVRTRDEISPVYGGPETTVGAEKRFHITRAARLWMHQNGISPNIPVRFDFAAVVWNQGAPDIKYYFDAFSWEEPRIRFF